MTLKETIIHESLKLFSLKGFLSTSIGDILEATKASKGGFYNHFKSKEDLFYNVLAEARRIWRERNLKGLDPDGDPVLKLNQFLLNFRDRYLKDSENFPGGCIFITLLVELKNQKPHLADEINKGFNGLKNMLNRYLSEAQEQGKLRADKDAGALTEMIFNSILGITITYNANKSGGDADKAIDIMIEFLHQLEN